MDAVATDRHLQRAIKISFSVLIFFLPLVLSTRSSEVFELPKILFVYAMTAVIVGLWLGRMVVRREILIRRTPLDIPILLFLISQIASTIYSIDPYVSWWGWYGRFHGGLISTISYTLLYYAFVSNYNSPLSLPVIGSLFSVFGFKSIGYQSIGHKPMNRKPADQNPITDNGKLITVILASALVVSLYAILQHFGIDKNFWVQDVVNRVFSTQGQPNWLAGYIVMVLPPAWMLTITDFKIVSGKRKLIAILLYCYIAILFLALLWTKSRSGLAGLAAADAVFWLAALAKIRKKEEGRRKKVRQFVLIHLTMMILILVTNNPVREWIFQKSQLISAKISLNRIMDKSDKSESDSAGLSIIRSSRSSRAADFSGSGLRKSEQGGTESGDIRRLVWSGAVQLVKQRPIFGFGPETFGETYWRVRPKEHNLTSEWNFLYNKAHNEWLNLAANTGVFGLGSHLLLLGWAAIWILLSVFRFQFSVTGLSVFSLPVIKPINRKPTDQNPITENREQITGLLIAILAALLGVEAVNFFGFSTVTIGTYRYLFMAAAVSAAGNTNKLLKPIADRAVTSVIQDRDRDRDRDRDENLRKNMNFKDYPSRIILQGLSLAVVAVVVFYILSRLFIFFLADLAYNRGRAYQDGGYVEEAVEPLMRAVNMVSGEPVFRVELAEAEGATAVLLLQQRTENGEQRTENSDIQETITQLKTDSLANFEIVRRQSPYNLGFVRTEAKMLFLLGNCTDNAVARSLDSPDRVGIAQDDGYPPLCDRALQLMKVAMELAPTNPQLPYSLGSMLEKMGQTGEAALYYNKAVELKPDYLELK